CARSGGNYWYFDVW
nr:immunoglobulin heavy chain junction region [Mus musculus]MBK4185783.1 immunoglobulin heavy chain junction region [Mus musculus]MBK4185784.1 immunoglobulin heavy chain junction region [Mus musculus]MBK4185785.1 immunoglobulin heavy chain junction region [Mus musculus]MBK4185786.1 immunoglobulin heavy chain junction region [Mus musculus]